MTEIDILFQETQAGSEASFAAWVGLVEPALRRSLRSFARSVDVEAVLQEGLLRMWVLAPRLELSGPCASLRYAYRLTKNLAISEARKLGTSSQVPLDAIEEGPELQVEPLARPDPRLRAIILGCIEKLPGGPRKALRMRLENEGLPDRELAVPLRMKINTFLQNIVRARRLVRACLEKNNVRLEEVLR